MADFQVLPMAYGPDGTCKSFIPDLVPTTLHSATWLDSPAPLFIQPLVFSRFDLPQNGYIDIQAKSPRKSPPPNLLPPNVIGRSRRKRAGFAVFTTFESSDRCDKPLPQAVAELKLHPTNIEYREKVDELFKERPIWTRNAIMTRLNCDKYRLKYSLSCSAYYFTNGPWRTLWVKFGYDPRKDPSSKIYQIMDFRINPAIQINEDRKNKKRYEMNYPHPTKTSQNQHRVALINTSDLVPASKDDSDESMNKLTFNEYFPGIVPSCRQCFYQLCDIHLDEVHELIHQNDGHEQFCHEKDGWCEPGTLEKCREIITLDLLKTIKDLKESQN